MEPEELITIHQCVHGYADGHRLLTASTELSTESRAALLVLSDLPDGVAPREFASYVTGYPLPGSSSYALARTWPAPEMPRPGCVWTHTLLIEYGELARLNEVSVLVKLHARPTALAGARQRALPITLHASALADVALDRAAASRLLSAVYMNAEAQVRINGLSDADAEGLVLAVWGQQWPRLRRTFSFRTARVAAVARTTARFDLVRGTASSQIEWHADPTTDTAIDSDAPLDRRIALLADDLQRPSSLRRHLWRFGADAGERAACLPLVAVFEWLWNSAPSESASSVLAGFVQAFPLPEQARQLKHALLDVQEIETVSTLHLVLLVEFIAGHGQGDAFGIGPVLLARVVKAIWRHRREELLAASLRLLTAPASSLRDAVLEQIYQLAEPHELIALIRERRGLAYSIVSQRPELASDRALWADNAIRAEVARALGRLGSMPVETLSAVVAALLASGASHLVRSLADALGAEFVTAVLRLLAAADRLPEGWGPEWRDAVSSQRETAQRWLEVTRPQLTAALVEVLSPLVPSVIERLDQLHGGAVKQLTKTLCDSKTTQSLDAVVLLLLAALKDRTQHAPILVGTGFAPIYEAAQDQRLSPRSTHELDRHLPSLGWWDDWDLCLRLATGLALALVEHGWKSSTLLEAANSPAILERTLHAASHRKRGRRWVQKVVEEYGESSIVTEGQREVLRRFR